MLLLDTTLKSIQITRSASLLTSEMDYTASYNDVDTSNNYTNIGVDGTTSGTGNVTVVSAPGASTTRIVKYLSIYNKDTKVDTIEVKMLNNASSKTLVKVTLQIGDTLQYVDSEGWSVLATSGGIKLTQPYSVQAGVQTASTGTAELYNSNSFSFGMNSSATITASFNNSYTANFFEVPNCELQTAAIAGSSNASNMCVQRYFMPYYMTATRFDMPASMTMSATATGGSWTISVAVYRKTGSMMSRLSSTFGSSGFASGGATNNTNSYNGVSGLRMRSVSLNNWQLTPGEYWMAIMHSLSNGVGGTVFGQQSSVHLGYPIGTVSSQGESDGIIGKWFRANSYFPLYMAQREVWFGKSDVTGFMASGYFRLFGT